MDSCLTRLLAFAVGEERAEEAASALANACEAEAGAFEMDVSEIRRVTGLPLQAAQLVATLPSLCGAMAREGLGEAPTLGGFDEAVAYARTLFVGLRYEKFAMLCLDRRARLLSTQVLQMGTLRETTFYLRHVLETALHTKARRVIFAHNHPGGTLEFTMGDQQCTKLALSALGPLGVALEDHIIVTRTDAASMRLRGVIPEGEWKKWTRAVWR